MALNRRQWLQRVSAGIVAACVVTKIPTAWIPAPVQSLAACEFLRREVNAWRERYGVDRPPKVIVADASLYAAYERELIAVSRVGGDRQRCAGLMFRDIRVHRSLIASNSGWRAVLVAGEVA